MLHVGDLVYLADGSVELRVTASGPERFACAVLIGAEVSSGTGINVTEAGFVDLAPTDDDRRHLSFAFAQAAQRIGVSFVEMPQQQTVSMYASAQTSRQNFLYFVVMV